MVLLDPVDSTSFEPASVLSQLAASRVPTAVVGAGKGVDCGSSYASVYEVLERAGTPRLLALVKQAGHLQFLDRRNEVVDVCTFGKASDASVHAVAQAVLCAWCASFVSGLKAGVEEAAVLRGELQLATEVEVVWERGGF